MGFMDNMLAKSDTRAASKIMTALAYLQSDVTYQLENITCSENAIWSHVSIRVNFQDEPGYFHRCRNVWHFSNNANGFMYLPLPQVSRINYDLAAVQIAAYIQGVLSYSEELEPVNESAVSLQETTPLQSLLSEIAGSYPDTEVIESSENFYLRVPNIYQDKLYIISSFVLRNANPEKLFVFAVIDFPSVAEKFHLYEYILQEFVVELEKLDYSLILDQDESTVSVFKELLETTSLDQAREETLAVTGLLVAALKVIAATLTD